MRSDPIAVGWNGSGVASPMMSGGIRSRSGAHSGARAGAAVANPKRAAPSVSTSLRRRFRSASRSSLAWSRPGVPAGPRMSAHVGSNRVGNGS